MSWVSQPIPVWEVTFSAAIKDFSLQPGADGPALITERRSEVRAIEARRSRKLIEGGAVESLAPENRKHPV
jgi:hypothetical protein